MSVSCIVCIATYLFISSQQLCTSINPIKTAENGSYRNVPPENSKRTPVHHRVLISSTSPPAPAPNILTTNHVPTAPTGAARLNTTKWALAPLFPNPCLSSTLVSPNAAGALWIMMARNIIKPSPVLEPEEWDAPSAIPSAAAWITRPSVVEKDRCCDFW